MICDRWRRVFKTKANIALLLYDQVKVTLTLHGLFQVDSAHYQVTEEVEEIVKEKRKVEVEENGDKPEAEKCTR